MLPHRSPTLRVVLVTDGRWPEVPGVCCWRAGVGAAFSAVGAEFEQVAWRPAPAEPEQAGQDDVQQHEPPADPPHGTGEAVASDADDSDSGGHAQAIGGLRRFMHRPFTALSRSSRHPTERFPPGGEVVDPPAPPEPVTRIPDAEVKPDVTPSSEVPAPVAPKRESIPSISGSDLVIAESLKVAQIALSSKVPADRIWVLVMPTEQLYPGAHGKNVEEISRIANRFGGILTDSELAREAVERAAAGSRPRVEVFPPLALDRSCRDCADQVLVDEGTSHVEGVPGLLRTWRVLAQRLRKEKGASTAFSFQAARLRGLSASWLPPQVSAWSQNREATTPSTIVPGQYPEVEWTSEEQVRVAGAIVDAAIPAVPIPSRPSRSVLIGGYDLKFAVDLAEHLGHRADLKVTLDEWPFVASGGDRTETLAGKADSLFAEWARPSATWYSRNKRADQLLVVRLHRFELDSPYPRDLVIDNVDAVVYVSPIIGRRIRDELGWPADKLVLIPNYLRTGWLDRMKLPGARFTLGFVGIDRTLKRLDLVLDVLAAVRREDPRFTLRVRSAMPWKNKSIWTDASERAYFDWCFQRIDGDHLLRDGVIFDPPGRDMARWYRRVGQMLSVSDVESFHYSVAEGMASGAVPVIRPWPGAEEIYGKEWIHHSVDEAVSAVLDNAEPEGWAERGARAREEIRRSHDPDQVVAAWADLLHGDVAGARRYFAAYSSL